MPLQFNLITNIDNGYGLQKDYEIIRDLLVSQGHVVNGIQFQTPQRAKPVDVNIYLETLVPLHNLAKENWVFPNPEWFEMSRDAKHLPELSQVLCKTHDSHRIFKKLKDNAVYMGFESRDLYRPRIKKERKFLHIAGKSVLKNTEAIIEAWIKYNLPYPLTIINRRRKPFYIEMPNVKEIFRISHEETFAECINSHLFHLCPSKYEGWGHYIHEAMGVGAIVITTDAPPMNENCIGDYFYIPSKVEGSMRMANLNAVDADGVAAAVRRVINMPEEEIKVASESNRYLYLTNRSIFRNNFFELVSNTEEKIKGNIKYA